MGRRQKDVRAASGNATAVTEPRALLVDTHSLFVRAFYALPEMTTRTGVPTSALYGLSVLLLKLLREQRPLGLAFALDTGQPTFRHVRSPTYKAQRAPLTAPLRAQLALLPRVLEAFGAPCFVAPGFEADDVLATLARQLSAEGTPVRVVSGDHDLFQVIAERVDVLFVGARGQPPTCYDLAAVTARYQLRPEQLPTLAALVGDLTDNLPKVPAIGERTAQSLVARFGDARGLLAHLDEVGPARVRAALARAAPQILATEELARLRHDVPLPDGPRHSPIDREHLLRTRALFEELEFKSLIERVDRLLA
jgi:DNA polymerase-1